VTVRGHQLAIDWSGNGTYTAAYEDVSSYVIAGDIEISWGRNVDGESVTLASTSGQLEAVLNDESAVFSQENTGSAINGKILPGRGVRYQATHLGTTYTLLQGVLDDFDNEYDPFVTFELQALDGWGRPGAEKLSTPLYRGARTGDAIGFVLDAIGWTGPREIDPGATVMPYWWVEGDDAATAITKLVHSEGAPAIAYVRGGTFVFRDRHHRILDARSTTSQVTCTHIVPQGAGPAGDLKIEAGAWSYNHGLKQVVNSATFPVDVRTLQQGAEVWSSDDAVSVAAGATLQVTIQADNPFLNAITPSVEEGDIVLQSGVVSAVTLSRTSGQSATLSITCSSPTVIIRMAVRANAAKITRTVQVSARDQGSIGRFGGVREWPTEAAPIWAGQYDAQVIANRIVTVYATYRPTITFTVPSLSDANLAAILGLRISDRITVRNDKRGINADFMVERLSHKITSLGLAHRLTITCQAVEPTQPTNVFTFDVAGKGFNQGAFGVDGIDSSTNVFRFDVAGQGFDQGVFAN
jgi:hypothetical protein